MKSALRKAIAAVVVPTALMTVVSCAEKGPEPTTESSRSVTTQPGVPGSTTVETYTITANILNRDAATRELILGLPGGKKETVKCGPEIRNFDQMRVGDQVTVMVAEELAVFMSTESAPADASGASLVALAPKGAKPGAVMATTVQITATVVNIDMTHHKATLQFPDGSSRTIAVRKDVDLSKRRVGEKVTIRKTEALAISVDKPAPQK